MPTKEKSNALVKLALFLSIFVIWQDGFFTPCLTAIYEALPTESTFLQTFVLTGPSLVAVPFMLASGALANRLGKRNLLIAGTVLYLVGNVGCAFVGSMEMLCVARALGGIGSNIAFTMVFAIMPEALPDEEENARVMGAWNLASSLIGAAISLVAGIVCTTGWRNVMLLNLVALSTLASALLFLPADGSVSQQVAEESEQQAGTGNMPAVWFYVVAALVASVLGMCNYYYPDLFVAEHQLGTSVLSGAMGTGYTIGGAITAIAFATFYEKLKKHLLFLLYGLTALGYLLLMIPGISPAMAIAALVIGGAGVGIGNCFFGFVIGRLAPSDKTSLMVSVWSSVTFLGIYICAMVPYWLQEAFGTALLTDTYLHIGIALVVIAVVFGIINYRIISAEDLREQ